MITTLKHSICLCTWLSVQTSNIQHFNRWEKPKTGRNLQIENVRILRKSGVHQEINKVTRGCSIECEWYGIEEEVKYN